VVNYDDIEQVIIRKGIAPVAVELGKEALPTLRR